jgi:hypothetical protein
MSLYDLAIGQFFYVDRHRWKIVNLNRIADKPICVMRVGKYPVMRWMSLDEFSQKATVKPKPC